MVGVNGLSSASNPTPIRAADGRLRTAKVLAGSNGKDIDAICSPLNCACRPHVRSARIEIRQVD